MLTLATAREVAALNAAVVALEDAAALAPTDAAVRNDLAVALLARSEHRAQPIDLVRALDWLEQVIAERPDATEALFNRALALQRLHLLPAAADAWRIAHDREPGSGWGKEAAANERAVRLALALERARRSPLPGLDAFAASPQLIQRLARENPQRVRLYVEERLLAAWADAVSAGLPDHREMLAVAGALGAALAEYGGDEMVARTVNAIEQAEKDAKESVLRALSAGHREFAAGLRKYEVFSLDEADAHFVSSRRLLESARSPFAGWPAIYLAICRYYDPDYDAALAALDVIARSYPETSYPVLRGRVEWMRGLIRYIQGRFGEGLVHYNRARELFVASGEEPYVAYIDALLAKTLRRAGAAEEAWQHNLLALAGRHTLSTPDRVFTILLESAEAAQHLGSTRASLRFFDELVPVALALERPFITLQAYLRRARARDRAGDQPGAVDDLLRAREQLARVSDAQMAASGAADLDSAEGEIWSARAPARAIAALDRALAYYTQTGDSVGVLSARRAQAGAHLNAGAPERAAEDLELGIQESERQRDGFDDPERRASYFAGAQSLFDGIVQLELQSLGRPDRAFSYVERGRNRLLLDLLSVPRDLASAAVDTAPRRSSLREAQESLPTGVALVVYAALEEHLAIWTVTSDRVESSILPIFRRELARLVARFRTDIERGAASDVGNDLAQLLVPPPVRRLPAESTLVIVPGPTLYDVPFAALPGSQPGTYLAAERPLLLTPSVSVYLNGTDSARSPAATARVALVIANPRFDKDRFPHLADLRGADEEGRRVAALYAGAKLVSGAAATPEHVLSLLPRAQVIHFAGHAIAGSAPGETATLVLAPDEDAPAALRGGALSAAMIRSQRLAAGPLVVLGGCSTAVGGNAGSEQVASLAGSFLAGGAQAVAASLWAVDDRMAGELLLAFHRHLRANDGPLLAFRRAQLESIASDDPLQRSPRVWAAFELFGVAESKPH